MGSIQYSTFLCWSANIGSYLDVGGLAVVTVPSAPMICSSGTCTVGWLEWYVVGGGFGRSLTSSDGSSSGGGFGSSSGDGHHEGVGIYNSSGFIFLAAVGSIHAHLILSGGFLIGQ
jgi:hypothetical protein